ncbi:MAG: DUF4143 domain-containing protein [Dysgonamonadaceae bacterium]|jgi:predicted AAA+ superfamily ATPase|nr:DUF4143 domain-containing protein [Dysgonamonadaceae bacterium]
MRKNPKEWERCVKSAVGAHLINSGLKFRFNVYYRNRGRDEVDYVIEKDNDIVALEVKIGKGGTNVGLSLFNEEFHPRRLYTIGTGGIPFEQFLGMNPADLFRL